MSGTGKRAMPGNAPTQAKKRKGAQWQKQNNKVIIESGDWGVFVTCDLGREGKCIAEAIDIFSQSIEGSNDTGDAEESGSGDDDDDDIEAQIRKEIEGMKPGSKESRPFRAVRMELPCVSFIRFDKSVDPVKTVYQICADAYANPEKKRSRWIKRMTPMTSVRKTLSVDFEAFAKEILKPHFHSGGPPKKYAIRPSVRGNKQFNRDTIIKTVADIIGPEHPVNLKNYDLIVLVDVIQNVVGMSVLGSDYDQLKRFNLAEIYEPTPKPPLPETTESKS